VPDARSPHLDTLFRLLRESTDGAQLAEAEDLIWALWCAHENEDAAQRMQRAMGAMARRELDTAQDLLDTLVEDWPQWAEAWNKRATVRFLVERDVESLLDVQRTLRLEPRHFGAVSGLGQICLRAGDPVSALVAFEHALRLNPNLTGVRDAVARLRGRVSRVLH
jgi:tetratricopeptide (TPR) repeat protein